jgi:tetratricopeptide (TPR) repeat protein
MQEEHRVKKALTSVLLLMLVAAAGFSDSFSEMIEQIDLMDDEKIYDEQIPILEKALTSANDGQKIAILWRMARANLNIAWRYKILLDNDEKDEMGNPVTKTQVLALYDRGENWAAEAIEIFERTGANREEAVEAYYWRASNVGQWGQTKGILASLFRTGPMKADLKKAIELDPEHADSYYVLSKMYEAVPLWSRNQAVKYGRESVRLEEILVRTGEKDEFDISKPVALAKALVARNWSSRKRGDNTTDKAEARALVLPILELLEQREAALGPGERLDSGDVDDLVDIREVLKKT